MATQQKIFYQILASTDSNSYSYQLSPSGVVAGKAQQNNQKPLSSVDSKKVKSKGDMFIELMEKDKEISELKRIIHDHLILSSQHIDPDIQASQNLSMSV